MRITPVDWKPVNDLDLEKKALETVKSSKNYCVLAGPGAGKTELLAQRACFLLQTNTCKWPRKILAISFKKDAAKNLAERVRKRCGDDLAQRFVSLTYDSFAKGILDHFRKALPNDYRPSQNYEIVFDDKKMFDQYFGSLRPVPKLNLKSEEKEYWKYLSVKRLPLDSGSNWDLNALIFRVWMNGLKVGSETQSKLSFSMISRLSEFLIRENKKIHTALVLSYSHVFLDEFQDTTTYQYDLIKTCFFNTNTILTAVGDKKQRIMVWAGADVEVFNKFKDDFDAETCELLMNYRSAPRLIEIQKILIENISGDNNNISAHEGWDDEDGVCEIWNFKNSQKEAEVISHEIKKWIDDDGLNPNDICIIVKQLPDEYCGNLINEMAKYDVKIRNESKLQDLISEECVRILLDVIMCAISKSAKEEWLNTRELTKLMKSFYLDEDSDYEKLRLFDQKFNLEIEKIYKLFLGITNEKELISGLYKIIDFFGKEKFLNHYPQYKQGTFFIQQINELSKYLWKEFESYDNWVKSVESLRGKDSLPLMTIHKSKGLEYNTIIFIGLENGAFWNFRKQPEEDTCAFFVAFSRAKVRVIFTFCENRPNNRYPGSISHITSLYSMLHESGLVETHDF
ncbi:MAG: ATP-dependent helicase (plasmid) [Candidatus Methanoperedens sp.]|uniref:UvrD-helicase domain-containing protein n=1 Tax=Candidatus Methanoperedens sp. BLZ2 TaxID=2035255 RepID=UPI000BE3A589|nr:ATP-dependent helicase [Candidatus Methanoperedens sp. BLZ2]KAB2945254.1 MAG: ATP-dependent helicase [Candidatus Methanoperedens sp.]MBZ0175603.1 ATP-dependent helicase [Candidatus Methanoperedens nitroreducens]WAH95124.1 MAG: ATP-dependent helicase [Candidatus Methanoperedens sp.]WAM22316.1 MAG: ATP-dependent helicase [Candidatus Methanoperedens sp.]